MKGKIAELSPLQDAGCAYPRDDLGPQGAGVATCGAPRRPGSSFCPPHHALCHRPPGSAAEARQLREQEALAQAVGGRLGRPLRAPPEPLLRRLQRLERDVSRPRCSRYVQTPMPHPAAARDTRPAAAGDNDPTPERRRHGPIERLPAAIADAAGRPARPYRAVDTLQLMERRGSISAGMRQAGEDFRARFAVAQLDPLRALDLSHLRLGDDLRPEREAPGLRIEAARRAVWRSLQAVGGIASPAGSCLWHVLGWQCSLKEWAFEQGWAGRRVTQEVASGILVAALGALESHLANPVFLRKEHFSLDKSGLM